MLSRLEKEARVPDGPRIQAHGRQDKRVGNEWRRWCIAYPVSVLWGRALGVSAQR